jgi:hypothetical protein
MISHGRQVMAGRYPPVRVAASELSNASAGPRSLTCSVA